MENQAEIKLDAFIEENGYQPLMHLIDKIQTVDEEIYIDIDKTQSLLSVERDSISRAAEFLADEGFCNMRQYHKCGFYLKRNSA